MILLTAYIIVSNASLLPYDAVEILIWRQPDLSGKYYIDADTTLNVPLIGKIPVAGVVVDSLETVITRELDKYYGDIFVDINCYYRINVFGEVKSPGFYYLKSGDNLANLLAMAGGATEQGSLGKIRVINVGSVRTINFEKILSSGKNIDKLNLVPGDVVIVSRRFMPALQEWSVLFTIGTLLLQVYTTYLAATN